MGSIVTSRANGIYEVIDGQQRLTTFLIITKILSEYFNDYITSEKIDIKDITKSHLVRFIKDDGMKRVKIRQKDRVVFENTVIDASKSDLELIRAEKITDKLIRSNPNNVDLKYRYAIQTIINKLNEITNDKKADLQKFVNYLYSDIYLVLIITTSTDTAVELFKIINDRGLDLEPADVIKASIFNKSKQSEDDFEVTWNKIKQKCDKVKIDMTTFFVLYQYYFYSTNPRVSLTKSFESDILPSFKNDGWELIKDIADFADKIPESYDGSIDSYMLALNYLPWNTYWRSILSTAKKVKFDDFNYLVRLLCCYYYINWILGATGNTIKTTSFNLIEYVGGMRSNKGQNRKSIQDIKLYIQEHLVKLYGNEYMDTVRNTLSDTDLYGRYGQKWLKQVLILVEYSIRNENNRSFIALEGNHLEHIIPRQDKASKREERYTLIQDWENFDKNYLNALCNLTLLEDTLNFEASNKNNDDKIGIYEGKSNESGHTHFILTRDIAELCKKKGGVDIEVLNSRTISQDNNQKSIIDYIVTLLTI